MAKSRGGMPLTKYSLVCWNVHGETSEGYAEKRQRLVGNYFLNCNPKPDIIFLQEFQWAERSIIERLSLQGSPYSVYASNESNSPRHSHLNCVVVNTDKFSSQELKDDNLHRYFDDDSIKGSYIEDLCGSEADFTSMGTRKGRCKTRDDRWKENISLMCKRICVVILSEPESKHYGRNDRRKTTAKDATQCKILIVVSFHNYNNKCTEFNKCPKNKLAEIFCKGLAKIGDDLKLPVILAGDFNVDVWRSRVIREGLKFIVHDYYPTERRQSLCTIDFFLLYSQSNNSSSIESESVESELPDNKTLFKELNDVSNHDPLKAVLQVQQPTRPSMSKKKGS